jgi:hypothetical protein
MSKKVAAGGEPEESAERPRERIVACALDLFHRNGIRGVGVEAIVEAAHTNKMTLYRHFGWAEMEAESPGDPVAQLYGFVRKVAKFIADDQRGCDLANAAVELTEAGHPALKVIEAFKVQQRDRLAKLCQAAGASEPGVLADSIVLLIEGARVSRRSVGTEGPSANLVRTADAVIASFGVPPRETASPEPKADEKRIARLNRVT